MSHSQESTPGDDRRDYPRLKASFEVRYGVCGGHGREVPGFTNNLSLGGLCFMAPETKAHVGDHLAVEIQVPGFDQPLYFLGQVVRTQLVPGGTEVACRLDWLGKSDRYREKLAALLKAHRDQPARAV
ncbi:MAG: PilZ domain-containing protein [Planctomycetota bacterium]